MKKGWKLFLSLILMVWVLFSVFTLLEFGGKYIGKNYFESTDFEDSLVYFYQELGPTILNPIDADDMKSKLTVSQSEIDEHRYLYGSLSEQIENIRQQYVDRIEEAKANNALDLEKKLIAERDAKIADITKNFESDEHIKSKILVEKEKLVDAYMKDLTTHKKQLLQEYDFVAFELTDVDTGETFTSGKTGDSSVYQQSFSSRLPFETWSVSEELLSVWYESNFQVPQELMDRFYNDEKSGSSKAINTLHKYEGVVSVPESVFNTSNYKGEYEGFKWSQILFSVIWLTGIIALLVLLFTSLKPKLQDYLESNKLKDRLSSWKIDIQVVLLGITALIFGPLLIMAYEPIEYINYSNTLRFLWDCIWSLGFMLVVGVAFLLQAVWLFDRVRTWDKLVEEVQQSWLWKMGESIKDLFLNRSIGVQSMVLIGAAFFGGIGLVGSAVQGGMFVVLSFACFIVGVPALIVFLSRMGYMNRIMKNTADMAEGRLYGDIKVQGKSPFSKHAENLNKLRAGVAVSMNEQAKSERLKTELITNVSHDLRTPLTSIITYTDLLKNPDITDEERKQYINVLDKKSARLKTLIEDLFEVSKMASGNIELHKQRVDLTQLVRQAVGEHEEDLLKARLDLRMAIPDMPVFSYVDGQKWWRVVDNLIVNVLKYSLEGTRVYVTLKRTATGDAEFVVKNVAKYEISENVDELFERFKRADASRHTEGSGLGLAIAQSIVDLHGGRMTIEVDGDLFKVTVTVTAG